MPSKTTKQFKERIRQVKEKEKKQPIKAIDRNILQTDIKNTHIVLNTKDIPIQKLELFAQLQDLIEVSKKDIKEGSYINLSNVVDCNYNLFIESIIDNNINMCLC